MMTLVRTQKILILDANLVTESAAEIGRINGRDDDWTPTSIVEAVEELESFGEGKPKDNGYEITVETISEEQNINSATNLKSIIEQIAELELKNGIDDEHFNNKLAELQQAIGQPCGMIAGEFFTNMNLNQWRMGSIKYREDIIKNYIKVEVDMIELS